MFDLPKPKLSPVGPMARLLRVPVAWLRQEAEAGRVPFLRCGKVFLFNPEAVEAVLVERASGACREGTPCA
jgi:hypothetical protein